jgi:hypothetical protein
MSCTNCGPKGGSECGYGYPYSGFFYDRYPPLRCPDDFYRQEMCDYLSEGFGCGMMPPNFPPRHPPPPPPETTGDIPTRRHFQPRPPAHYWYPTQPNGDPRRPPGTPVPPPNGGTPRAPGGDRQPSGGDRQPAAPAGPPTFAAPIQGSNYGNVRGPHGQVGMTPMDVVITPEDMRWYYNTWTRIRSIKPYMPVPYTIPLMGCHGPAVPSMRGGQSPSGCQTARPYAPMVRTQCYVPPGLMGDNGGPVTTRPPPLDDPAINNADQNLEDALDAMDEATASGQGEAEAAAAVEQARKDLERTLAGRRVTEQQYLDAKAQEQAAQAEAAAQAAGEMAAAAAQGGSQTKDKGVHPAWWLALAATTLGAGYAGYRYGSK